MYILLHLERAAFAESGFADMYALPSSSCKGAKPLTFKARYSLIAC